MNTAQSKATLWALLPMAVGVSILGLFVVTDAQVLAVVGVTWLYVGFVINAFGAVLVVVGHRRALRDGVARLQRWRVTGCLSALLLANWPVAGVCTYAGWLWFTRYSITLRNEAATPWSVELRGPGVAEGVTVPADAATSLRVWFDNYGALTLHADGADTVVDGYVAGAFGGAADIVRARDGAVVVREQRQGRRRRVRPRDPGRFRTRAN